MALQKGQILNPLGRNSRKPITDAIMSILSRDSEESLKPKRGEKITNAQRLALTLIEKAKDGDPMALKEVIDRSDGKAIQQLDIKHVDPFDQLTTDDLIAIGNALGVRLASLALETTAGSGETET